jgi:hypothetical protein
MIGALSGHSNVQRTQVEPFGLAIPRLPGEDEGQIVQGRGQAYMGNRAAVLPRPDRQPVGLLGGTVIAHIVLDRSQVVEEDAAAGIVRLGGLGLVEESLQQKSSAAIVAPLDQLLRCDHVLFPPVVSHTGLTGSGL